MLIFTIYISGLTLGAVVMAFSSSNVIVWLGVSKLAGEAAISFMMWFAWRKWNSGIRSCNCVAKYYHILLMIITGHNLMSII